MDAGRSWQHGMNNERARQPPHTASKEHLMGTAGAAPALQCGDGAVACPVAPRYAKGTALIWPQRGRLERRFYFLGPTLPLPLAFFLRNCPFWEPRLADCNLAEGASSRPWQERLCAFCVGCKQKNAPELKGASSTCAGSSECWYSRC
jgi:hypothetical protein